MNAEQVTNKYCNTCQHKKKCYKPCVVVLRALISKQNMYLEESW